MRTKPVTPILATLSILALTISTSAVLAEVSTLPAAATTSTAADRAGGGDFGAPHPEAPEGLSQFAFLIGHWACDVDILNPDLETRTKASGTWTAYYALDGRAIMDDFRGAFGEGYIATTFRAYNVRDGRWNGYWLDGQRGFWSQPLVGGPVDGGILLETQMKAQRPDGTVLDLDLEYNFYEIRPDRFRWRQNTSMDGKETWMKDTMLIDCRRLAGPAGR